jgi:DNA-binding NarL/FixJ family response regulator
LSLAKSHIQAETTIVAFKPVCNLTQGYIVDTQQSIRHLIHQTQTLSALNSLEILGLSQRETEVLALVMQGKENKTIAAQLCIHNGTVRKHLENI